MEITIFTAMEHFFTNFLQGIHQTSPLEWLAVCCSICYLLLAIKESIYCWLFAFISSSIYVYIAYSVQLHLDALLQLFYVTMAVVGYVNWNKQQEDKKIIVWKFRHHFINIIATLILSVALGYIFQKYTNQQSPYLDAMATCFSLTATFMVTKKVLENWIYWIVIDSALVYLYLTRNLELTSVLMFIYTILALKGYFTWRKHYQTQLVNTQ